MSDEARACLGTTTAGSPCRSSVIREDGYCLRHSPDPLAKELAATSSLRGALTTKARHHKGGGLHAEELGALATIPDAQRWLHRIAQAIGDGSLTHAAGTAMTRAVSEWLKSEDMRLRSEDLADLQRQLKELKKGRKLEAVR